MKLWLAFAALLCACSSGPRVDREEGSALIVASDLDNMPFAGVDEDGRAVGRDVEMMEALGASIHRPVQWERLPFDELLGAVARGDVHAVCATVGITEERRKRVDFTPPYFETSIAVVVRSGEGEPRSLADLRGLRVSGGRGTTSEAAVRRHLPEVIGVFENKSGAPTQQRLLEHEIDAAVMDGPAADALVQAGAGKLLRLSENLEKERYSIALPRGATYGPALNEAVMEMHRSGRMAALNRRFGLKSDSD